MSTNCWLKTAIIYLLMVLKCGLELAGWFFSWSWWESLCGCIIHSSPGAGSPKVDSLTCLPLFPRCELRLLAGCLVLLYMVSPFLEGWLVFLLHADIHFSRAWEPQLSFWASFEANQKLNDITFVPFDWQKQVTSQLRFQGWRNKFHIVMEGAAK